MTTEHPTSLEEQALSMVFTAIRAVLEEERGSLSLTLDTTFEDLGMRSLDVVTIAFELEDAFGIHIHTNSLDDFRSVRQARDTVVALVRAKG